MNLSFRKFEGATLDDKKDSSDEEKSALSAISPAIGAVKSAAGKSGIFTRWYEDRFSPTQSLRGELAKQKVLEELEKRKSKRQQENLKVHFNRLAGEEGQIEVEIPDDSESEQLAFEWFENVKDINPNNEELSALWYGVLWELSRQTDHSKLLMKELQQLSVDDVSFLMRSKPLSNISFFKKIRIRKREPFSKRISERLEQRGLIRRRIMGPVSTTLFMALLPIYTYLIAPVLDFFQSRRLMSSVSNSFLETSTFGEFLLYHNASLVRMILSFMFLIGFGAVILQLIRYSFWLTPEGLNLVKLGERELSRLRSKSND
ncbi:MAG: hypothetical protein CMK09_17015 [Ponticaulis sp.]|nr:hypothetical protein [Ponticaulis sp.]|tara:strand:+ start:7547 stop:8497 length:951 start_codon:yes stop_codon:yes gene_type:complete